MLIYLHSLLFGHNFKSDGIIASKSELEPMHLDYLLLKRTPYFIYRGDRNNGKHNNSETVYTQNFASTFCTNVNISRVLSHL